MKKQPTPSPQSIAAQAGREIDAATGAVVPPIHMSATYARNAQYELQGDFLYSRCASPSVATAEDVIARLEGAEASRLFGTGMAATAAVIQMLPPGGHVVIPNVMYFANNTLIEDVAQSKRISVTCVDPTNLDAVAAACQPGKTSLIWVETPSNPTWDIVDIEAVARIAHDAGAQLCVDGTGAPPCTTLALNLGADMVFHSATKYLNGHSDLTGGVVSFAEGRGEWIEALTTVRTRYGSIMAPFEAWLLLRGLKTLFVRFERSSENAMAVAKAMENDSRIVEVRYPGLPTHPGHEIAKKQMTGGFGGMASLILKGSEEDAMKVAASTQVFVPATSLGSTESLIEHRKTIEGDESDIPATLIRLSIGLESADDLIADLKGALTQLQK